MNFTINEIALATGGSILVKGEDTIVTGVSIDNRQINEGDLFFAIKGERFNPNEKVLDIFEKGASVCIVDEVLVNINDIPKGKTLIKVDNVRKSLGFLGKYHKENLDVKVVAVTGSVGKTSTRDMISAVLSSKYKVFKTKGNFNSEVGLPLMLLQLDNSYDIAVLEMGMDQKGNIEYLVELVNPEIAVITNIGLSHIQNFENQEGIFDAKMEITSKFNTDNILIVNGDDKFLNKVNDKPYKVIKVGENISNDIYANEITLEGINSKFKLNRKNESYLMEINQPGRHNIVNSLLSVAVGDIFDIPVEDVEASLNNIEKTSMRLDFIKKDKFTFINDCYNASPDSMKAAIDVLSNIDAKRRICILGSMFELGEESLNGHREVGEFAKEKKIDLVLATGEYTSEFKKALGANCLLFKDKNSLTVLLKDIVADGDVILVKASRGMKFESIVEVLNDI